MGDRFYPPIPANFIYAAKILSGNCNSDPGYLGSECPYPADVMEGIKEVFLRTTPSVVEPVLAMDPDDLDLGQEAMSLYVQLGNLETDTSKLDIKDKIQVAKAKAALLEKLLALQEKATNVKSMREFQDTIIHMMESVLTEDQRLDFIAKVRGLPTEDTE